MADDTRSIPQLIGDFTSDFTTLLRKESQLVRTEFSEKVHQLVRAGGEAAAGAILLLAALLILLQALVLVLAKFMDPALASAIVGAVVAVLGVIMLKAGANAMSAGNLKPDKTIRQVGKDAQLAKEQVK
jgi:xanthine/uracil permease